MSELCVTIAGEPFDHLVYHFVLTYSNWEAATICFSESFESLSEGLQNALWELGGVPRRHRTDRMSAAVNADPNPELFTRRYQALLVHYGLEAQAIQPRKANQNGDVEQSHHRFKRAVDQALMLRGSRAFASRGDYQTFLRKLMTQRNSQRKERFLEETAVLSTLPARRLEMARRIKARVDPGSTIHVGGNTYSLPSRLIGELVDVHVMAETLEVWHGARTGRHLAAAAWPQETPHRVPPRHRLAGTQAGSVRGVPLPRRDVSDQPIPDRLRRAEGPAAQPRGPGISGRLAPRRARGRGRSGRHLAAVARRRAHARRSVRGGGAASGPTPDSGDRCDDCGCRPDDVRPALGAKGGS